MGRKAKRKKGHRTKLATGRLVEIQHGWMTLHVRPAAAEAARVEREVRLAAQAGDMELLVSTPRQGLTFTFHWRFVAINGGREWLHYWPGSGSWWSPATGERGKVQTPWAALETAENARSSSEASLDQPYPGRR